MYFDDDQTDRLNAVTRQIEERTGVRVTTAVVDRSDDYPEIAWKSFAAVICVHALVQLIQTVFPSPRPMIWGVPHILGFILGTSAAVALLTQWWPPFGRLFLDRSYAAERIQRYADSCFLRQRLFQTPSRNGILLLVSLFERQAVLLTDSGIAAELDQGAREQVLDRMAPFLRREDPFQAISHGLAGLEAVLSPAGLNFAPMEEISVPDKCISSKGPDG